MQIHELANLSGNPASGTSFVVDNGSATRKIDYTTLAQAIVEQYAGSTLGGERRTIADAFETLNPIIGRYNNVGVHNSLFRAKNLGTSISSEQMTQIVNGTFDDMFIGDYWIINDKWWRIAHFDPYYGLANPNNSRHHIAVVRDVFFPQCSWGSAVGNGYAVSNIRTTIKETVLSGETTTAEGAFVAAFGDEHVLTYKDYFPTAYNSSGFATAGTYFDARVELLSEVQLMGFPAVTNVAGFREVGLSKSQFALFALNPRMISGSQRNSYWLRSVNSSNNTVAQIINYGVITSMPPTASAGLRPFALIG